MLKTVVLLNMFMETDICHQIFQNIKLNRGYVLLNFHIL